MQSTPDPDRTSQQRRKGNQSAARSRKIKTPSPPLSQEDEPMELDSDDDPVNELDNLPIVIDDPSYVVSSVMYVLKYEIKMKLCRTYCTFFISSDCESNI